MAAGNDTVNIKVKYIPDTSALKNIKEIRMPEIKVGGKDAGKGVFDSYNNAIRELNRELSKGTDASAITKAFKTVGEETTKVKTQINSMKEAINQSFQSPSNQSLIKDYQNLEKQLKKLDAESQKRRKKSAELSSFKSQNNMSTPQARKEISKAETLVAAGEKLTKQDQERLEIARQIVAKEEELAKLRTQEEIRNAQKDIKNQMSDSKYDSMISSTEANRILGQYNDILSRVGINLNGVTGESKRFSSSLDEQVNQVKAAKKEVVKFGDIVSGTFLGTSLSNLFQTGLSRGIEFFKDYDEILTRTMMVTGQTREEVNSLTSSYNKLANQLSSTTKDVAAAQLVFYQQGLGTSEALKMTEASIAVSKTGGIDAAEAADRLTAAVRGYQLSANEAMVIADKMSSLDAAAASSVDELTVAMQKSASQARMAGLDLDYYMAYLSTMQEVTREAPENIGTAMKSITSRLQEIKDIGKIEEDGTTFSNVAKALTSIGIAATDSSGQLRTLQDIMNELGPMWNTLDRNHKAYIATVLAGNRQQSRFIALMDNYDRAMELVDVSQNASGESAKQLRAYNQGLEASFTRLNNAWQQLATNIADSSAIKKIIDLFSTFVEILNKIPKRITSTVVPLLALTKVFTTLSKAGNLFKGFKTWSLEKLGLKDLSSDLNGLGKSFQDVGNKANSVWSHIKNSIDGLGNYTKAINETSQALEDNTSASQSNELAQENLTRSKQSDDLVEDQEIKEAGSNTGAQIAMKKAYEQATDAVKTQLDIMSTNSDGYIQEQERAIRETEAQIKKNKAEEQKLLEANEAERARRKSELQTLREGYERKVKNPDSKKIGGELYEEATESLRRKGLLGDVQQLSLFGDDEVDKMIEEEMGHLAKEYGIGYHELQEVLKDESDKIFNINNDAIEELRKSRKNLTKEVSTLNKDLLKYKSNLGKQKKSSISLDDPKQVKNARDLSKKRLDAFKNLDSVSIGQVKDITTDKFLTNSEKISAVFSKINVGGGLVAGSLARMGASFLGLDDDMSSALSTSVGLATSFAKFAPPWGAIIGASIGGVKLVFDKLWPSVEKVEEKITDLQTEMDKLKQKSSDIELNLDTYTSLINKLDKTEEETSKLKDATDALVDALPRAVSGYDSFGNAIINTGIAMSELSNLQKEQAANAEKQIESFGDLQEAQISGWEKGAAWIGQIAGLLLAIPTSGLSLLLNAGATADMMSWDSRQIDANKKILKENYSEIYSAMQETATKTVETGSKENKQLRQAWSNALINDALSDAMNGDSVDSTSVEKVEKEIEQLFKQLDGYTMDSLIEVSLDAKTDVEIKESTWAELKENVTKQVKAKVAHLNLSDEKINAIIDVVMDGSWNLTNVKTVQDQLKQAIEASTDVEFRTNALYFSDSLDLMQQDMYKFLDSMGLLDARFANMFANIGGNEQLGKMIRDANGEIDESRGKIILLNQAYKELNAQSGAYSKEELEKLRAEKEELEKEKQKLIDENESYDKGWFGNLLTGDERASYSEKYGWMALSGSKGADLVDNLNSVEEKINKINEKLATGNGNLEKTEEVIKNIIASIEATEPPTFNELSEELSKISDQFQQIFSLAESLDETNGKMSLDNISELFSILGQFEPESFADMSLDTYALWMDSVDKINKGLYEQNGVLVAQTSVMDGLNQLASVNAKLQIEKYNATIDASNAELQYQNQILQTQYNAVDAAIKSLEAGESSAQARGKAEEQLKNLEELFSADRVRREVQTNNTILTYASKFASQYARIIKEANEGIYSGDVKLEDIDTSDILAQLKSDLSGELNDLIDKNDLSGLYDMRDRLSNQMKMNNDTIEKTNALKKKVTDYLTKESTNLAGVAKGYENASDKAKDYNEKLERTLTLLEKIEGLQHKIDENETFKDLYDGYSGEDYGRLLMSNLDLAQQQYEVYKDLFDMQQEMTNQAAGDLLDSPYGEMFKIQENGDIGWADLTMYDKYKNMPADMKEDIDNLVEAYQNQRDALRDTENDLAKYAQEVKKVREELVQMQIEIENELVDAIKNREKILHDARVKALDDEIDMIEKAVEARKKAQEDDNSNKELYKAQEALRRATLDSSGKNNAQLLQLQQDLEDKQLEIAEKRFEDDMDDRKQWLQDTKDAETETYDYRLEKMTWYWEQVQAIQEAGTEAMMETLIHWNIEYAQTSEYQQGEMERKWKETMDAMKAATDMGAELGKLTSDIVSVTQTVEAMNIKIQALPGSWQKATDAVNGYINAASRASSYGGTKSTSSSDLKTGGNNNNTKTDKNPDKQQANLFSVGDKIKSAEQERDGGINQVRSYWKDGDNFKSNIFYWEFGSSMKGKKIEEVKKGSDGKYYYRIPIAYSNEWFREDGLMKYASGGMVDYTGPAWVDGNKTHPEAFLSAYQTEQIGALAKSLDPSTVNNATTNSNVTFGSINFNVASMSSAADGKKALDVFVQGANDMMAKKGIGTKLNINMK